VLIHSRSAWIWTDRSGGVGEWYQSMPTEVFSRSRPRFEQVGSFRDARITRDGIVESAHDRGRLAAPTDGRRRDCGKLVIGR
jgi:hypothetical protein